MNKTSPAYKDAYNDRHWDSYSDSRYHDYGDNSVYRDYGDSSSYHDHYKDGAIVPEQQKIKVKTIKK